MGPPVVGGGGRIGEQRGRWRLEDEGSGGAGRGREEEDKRSIRRFLFKLRPQPTRGDIRLVGSAHEVKILSLPNVNLKGKKLFLSIRVVLCN